MQFHAYSCSLVDSNGLLDSWDSAVGGIEHWLLDSVDAVHIGLNVFIVDVGGSVESGVEEDDQGGQLEHVVEGDQVENESGKLVDHAEQAEDHPVSQPLLVVGAVRAGWLEGVETHEHGVSNCYQVCDDGLADAEDHEQHEADQGVLEHRLLGEAACLRNFVQKTHTYSLLFSF